MTFSRCCLAALLLLPLFVALGCRREEPPPPPPPGGDPKFPGMPFAKIDESEPHAAGKKLFNMKCVRCHTIGGDKGGEKGGEKGPPPMPPMPNKGPDLAKAAKDDRKAEWFISYVSDPRKVKTDSKMPAFEGKLKAEDMRALADFLASLK